MKRVFFPNEEWAYFKIFCNIRDSDNVLINSVYKIAYKLKKMNLISKWFYIRYFEEDYHLRIRFKCITAENNYLVYKYFCEQIQSYVSNGIIWKIQLDTYFREMERYGDEEGIEFVESLFEYDSVAIIKILTTLNNDIHEEDRWKYGILLLDFYSNLFNYKIETRVEIFNDLFRRFIPENAKFKSVADQIKRKYYENKDEISTILSTNNDLTKISELNVKEFTSQIQSIKNLNHMTDTILRNMFESIVHMSINRLFRNNQNKYETILYSLIFYGYMEKLKHSVSHMKK